MVSPPGGNSREVSLGANSATPAADPMLASDARARLQREVHALAMMPVSVASLKLSIGLGFERCGTPCSLPPTSPPPYSPPPYSPPPSRTGAAAQRQKKGLRLRQNSEELELNAVEILSRAFESGAPLHKAPRPRLDYVRGRGTPEPLSLPAPVPSFEE